MTACRTITFITPTPPDISAFGVRALSAWLKQKGHTVRCIFLPGGIEQLTHAGAFQYTYTPEVVGEILAITEDADVVAFSFLSQYRDRAIQLTRAVKDAGDAFVVWGGIHPEVDPGDALDHADAVCICEGEMVIEQLLDTLDTPEKIHEIPGLLTRESPDVPSPDKLPCINDLDSLPWMDMGPENHYVLDPPAGRVVPMTGDTLKHVLPLMPAPGGGALTVYRTMTSRGCPHHCTYCANRIRAQRFPGTRYLRFRSPDHVMGELHQVSESFPFIQGIHFFDDVFTAMPPEDLNTLCRRLKEEIGLPWYAQASPALLTREQLELFIETGLVFIEMGIQTGSETVRRMYKRPESNETILNGVRLVHEYRDRLLKPHYHVILDNPWETRDDVRATLDLLTRIPGRFQLCLASLTFYPGTDLADKAQAEGILTDFERQVYRKPFYIPRGRYLNYLIYLTDITWIPRGLLRWLGGPPAQLLDRPVFGPLFDLCRKITDKLRLAGKGFDAIKRGQFHRIRNYFKRVR